MAGDRVLTVRIAGDAKGAVGAIGTVEGATVGLGKKILKIGALFAGLNIGANMVRDFVEIGKSYTRAMNVMQVTSKATDKQMKAVGRAAKDLGADLTLPGVSAADAAQAMTEIVKSGYSVEEAMDAAQGSLQLAGAANIDAATAAGIMADALSMFQLEGKEANSVADRLAQTTASVSGEITDTAEAFKNAGPVWATAGFSVDELSTAIGMMAQNGIRGAEAGTTLKSMMLRLQAPTGAAATTIDELGISVYDAEGNIKSFKSIIGSYTKATKDMTQEEKDKTAAVLFGQRAIKGANLTLARGTKAYDKLSTAIDGQASAADQALAKNEGFGGAVDQLESQIESLYLIIWDHAAPAMEKITRKTAAALEAFNDFIDKPSDLADSLNKFDGTKFGNKIVEMIEDALDKIGDMSGDLADSIRDLVERVDWVGLGIEAGKAALPLVIGLATGIINSLTDPKTWKQLGDHWQEILLAVLGIAFAPAKWIAKISSLLRKIPIVGKLIAWLLTSINKVGGKFKKFASGLWKSFSKGFKIGMGKNGPGFIKTITGFFRRLGKFIREKFADAAKWFGNGAKEMAERFGNWLGRHGPRQAWQALVKLKDKVARFFSNVGNWLTRHGRNLLGGLLRGIGEKLAGIAAILFRVKMRVFAFFGNVGGWLFASGMSLIIGFADGIWAAKDRVVNAAAAVAGAARNLFPFSPAKEGPFSGRGWVTYSGKAVSGGFADGMISHLSTVRKAAEQMATAAHPNVDPLALPETHVKGSRSAYLGARGHGQGRGYLRGSNGGSGVNVYVNVEGNVIGEKDFAKRVTPTVRNELVKIGKRNGGGIFGGHG